MVIPSRCCCGCEIFFDDFERPGGTAADGVNLPGSDRYDFAPASWSVTGSKLVCNSAGELITFFRSGSRVVNVEVDVDLVSVGDYVEIVFGGNSVRAERLPDDIIEFSSGAVSFQSDGTLPGAFTFYAHFFRRSQYEEEFACFSPDPSEDFVRFGPSRFVDCPWLKTDLSGGFEEWGLKANSGAELDDLKVFKALHDCESFDVACTNVCWDQPSEMMVSISGAVDDQMWCGPVGVPAECEEARTDCLLACAIHDPGSFEECQCICACYVEFNSCHCGFIEGAGQCEVSCKCSAVNGSWVMAQTGQCSCYYSVDVGGFTANTLDWTTDPACEDLVYGTPQVSAELIYRGCDLETGQSFVEIFVAMPFSSSTVSYYATGTIDADLVCSGGSAELFPVPEGAEQFADGVLMGCGCSGGSGYGCGDETACSYFVGEEEFVLPCTEAFEFECPGAEHTPMAIGPDVEVIV